MSPSRVLPDNQNALEISRVYQIDEGNSFDIRYKGFLIPTVINADSQIKMHLTIRYPDLGSQADNLEVAIPIRSLNSYTRFFVSSTCVEGSSGGCAVVADRAMAAAMAKGKNGNGNLREAVLEISFSDEKNRVDNNFGLGYKVFFPASTSSGINAPSSNIDNPINLSRPGGGVGGGCSGQCGLIDMYMLVKNLGVNKRVGIVYQRLDANNHAIAPREPWEKMPATYAEPGASAGMERWRIAINFADRNYKMEFAVFYEINGTTYWDNNYGRNYIWDNAANSIVQR
jgi:hypothetical protein